MTPSKACYDLIKSFEALELDAYPDPKTGGKPWTIGYGHTHGVCQGDHCNEEQALLWLEDDVAEAARLVNAHFSVPKPTQGQFDALVSIVYNVGPGGPKRDGIVSLRNGNTSTLRARYLVGDMVGAANEFDKWVSPGSNVERGLRRRRALEKALFQSGE